MRHQASTQSASQSTSYEFGTLRVDLFAHRAFVGEREVHLTRTEFKLLAIFVRHAGKVLQYRYLGSEIWGPTTAKGPQNVRVLMASLRRKIEDDSRGPGFCSRSKGSAIDSCRSMLIQHRAARGIRAKRRPYRRVDAIDACIEFRTRIYNFFINMPA